MAGRLATAEPGDLNASFNFRFLISPTALSQHPPGLPDSPHPAFVGQPPDKLRHTRPATSSSSLKSRPSKHREVWTHLIWHCALALSVPCPGHCRIPPRSCPLWDFQEPARLKTNYCTLPDMSAQVNRTCFALCVLPETCAT